LSNLALFVESAFSTESVELLLHAAAISVIMVTKNKDFIDVNFYKQAYKNLAMTVRKFWCQLD